MLPVNLTIWKHVSKMLKRQYTSNEMKIYFSGLSLSKKFGINKDLVEFLLKLNQHDSLVVLRDILQIPDFWLNEYDKTEIENSETMIDNFNHKNPYYPTLVGNIGTLNTGLGSLHPFDHAHKPTKYNPPEHKYGAIELIDLLNSSGIIYNRNTNKFILKDEEEELLIDIHTSAPKVLIKKKVTNYFYAQIIEEINGCYMFGYRIACATLIRKLFENLLIDCLIQRFPPNSDDNKKLYYMAGGNRFKDFSNLIKALTEKKIGLDDGHNSFDLLLIRLYAIRDLGNKNAHKITYKASQKDILELKVYETMELFLRIFKYDQFLK